MRSVNDSSQFTPFGLWIREYLRPSSDGFSVTNLDYVFEDYKNKKIMLVEEKQSGGVLHKSQMLTFDVLDRHLSLVSKRVEYDYWGFFCCAVSAWQNNGGTWCDTERQGDFG